MPRAKDKRAPADRFGIFKAHLRRQRLKSTAQRDAIARIFFASKRHSSIEELYNAVKQVTPGIGYATVYRTMKLLTESGLAVERHFHDGEARYESTVDRQHHDHLICESCGKIVEFEEPRIEALQEEVAHRLGFRLSGHKMELYGHCRDCQKTGRAAK